ncbi:MAG: hypothetical protein HYY25_17460 [Candidatus Wallbacteria bacterium]|nr:hypothetical protein [Candidatus Wallbacteria bacterium]
MRRERIRNNRGVVESSIDMSFLESVKSALGLVSPCPKCGERLSHHRLFTAPAGDDLVLVEALMKLGRARDETVRAEVEGLIAGRLRLPADTKSGVQAQLSHCPACKFGKLELALLKDGRVLESRCHSATGTGYGLLSQLLGGK